MGRHRGRPSKELIGRHTPARESVRSSAALSAGSGRPSMEDGRNRPQTSSASASARTARHTDHCFSHGLHEGSYALALLILVLIDEFVDRAVSFVFFDTLVDIGKIFHEGRFLRNGDVEALLVHKLRQTFEFALLPILL
jgi:hypothetical protein